MSPIEEVQNIMSNDDLDYQSQIIEWVKNVKAKNHVKLSFQNENVK